MKFLEHIIKSDGEIFDSGSIGFGFKDSHRPTLENGIFRSVSVTRTYYNIVEEIDKRDLPFTVQREAENILIKYLKDKQKDKQKVTIKNIDEFIETLIYYAYVINGLKVKKPKTFHKELKKYIRHKFNTILNRKQIELRNSSFKTLIQKLNKKTDEDENYLYMITHVIDNVFRKKYEVYLDGKLIDVGVVTRHENINDLYSRITNKYGNNVKIKISNITTRSRSGIVGAVLLMIFYELNIPQSFLYNRLGIVAYYSQKLLKNNKEVFEDGFRRLSKKDKYLLLKGILGLLKTENRKRKINTEKLKEMINDEKLYKELQEFYTN